MTPTRSVAVTPGAWQSSGSFYFNRELRDVLFLVAHLPLGLAVSSFPLLAKALAIGVVAAGVFWSLDPRTVRRTVYAAAYVAGAEVCWRMTGATPVYEYGKYAITLLMILAVLRSSPVAKTTWLPLIYLALLLPSISLTISALGMTEAARQQVSFNLSGPLALALSAFFFLRVDNLFFVPRTLLMMIAAPTLLVLAIAGESTLTAEEIYFSTQSNFVTSGGFGPNQVSAALGLGALLLVLLAFSTHTGIWRIAFLALGSALLAQAVLTFSRGGVFNALVGVGLMAAHYLRRRGARVAVLVSLTLLALIGAQVVLPALDRFTGGFLSERYSDVDPGLRRSMAEREIGIWLDNPILGVGPGMGRDLRAEAFGFWVAAHTEYTRLLSEHGVFGLGSLIILFWLVGAAYLRAPMALPRAWVAVLSSWAMLEMFHAAMRIGAISFVFGAALLVWRSPPGTASSQAPPPRALRQ